MTSAYQGYKFFDVSLYPLPKPTPTLEFSLAALLLPNKAWKDLTLTDKAAYRSFIDDFGTHYMTQASMGALALATTFFHSCFLDIWSGESIVEESSSSFIGIFNDKHGKAHGCNSTSVLFEQWSDILVQVLGGDMRPSTAS